MCDKLKEVRKDIAELEKLETQATRQKVKDILSIEVRRLVSEAVKLEERSKTSLPSPSESVRGTTSKCYQVKLNNYAWDQTPKYLKLYVTLPKVQTLGSDNVFCNWTKKSVELNVKGLENKDYVFTIKSLLADIDPAQSSWKIKTDMVLILAAKDSEQNWTHVTEYEKRASDSKKIVPEKDEEAESAGPEDSLMSMMKKMYETGDDDMKRIIAKAWHEGQNKKSEI